jgi:two-component system OmpR family response regulator
MQLAPHLIEQPVHTILVVDDDDDLRTHVAAYLGEHDLQVVTASDATTLSQRLSERSVDLIVLDVMLPGEDGLSICRRLRGRPSPPVIMLSAMGEEIDRIVGLEVGADDYIPKPCSPRELLARIRAVLRRRQAASGVPWAGNSAVPTTVLEFDGFRLHMLRRQLYAPNGAVIVLSNNELSLLTALLERPNEVFDRAALAHQANIGDPSDVDRAVDMQISRLRRKLHAHSAGELIATIRGRGYRLNARSVVGHYEIAAVNPNPWRGRAPRAR